MKLGSRIHPLLPCNSPASIQPGAHPINQNGFHCTFMRTIVDERLVNQRKSITMKFSSLFLLLLTKLLFYMSTAAHGAATCEPDGDIQFICGIMNAEDIIEIPGSDFVIT